MSKYQVRFEQRNHGAIGIFEWSQWFEVEAVDGEEARDAARAQLGDYETRGVECREVLQ
jgi:hypothetical protein